MERECVTSSSLGLAPRSGSQTVGFRFILESAILKAISEESTAYVSGTPSLHPRRPLTSLSTTNAVIADDLYYAITIDNEQKLYLLQPCDGYLHAS